MAGSIPPLIAAEAILMMAGKFAAFFLPFLAVAALWWLANNIDWIIARNFPHLEWEKDLGWLNIKAERRARTALRLLGAAIYLVLAVALLAIPWNVRQIADELVPGPGLSIRSHILVQFGVVVICLGMWVVFLGSWLVPRIRASREERGLRTFRTHVAEIEKERERHRPRQPAPLVSPVKKPRSNSPYEDAMQQGRPSRLRPPGE